jgi:hypothetical protein
MPRSRQRGWWSPWRHGDTTSSTTICLTDPDRLIAAAITPVDLAAILEAPTADGRPALRSACLTEPLPWCFELSVGSTFPLHFRAPCFRPPEGPELPQVARGFCPPGLRGLTQDGPEMLGYLQEAPWHDLSPTPRWATVRITCARQKRKARRSRHDEEGTE